jgi:hypothetical protein
MVGADRHLGGVGVDEDEALTRHVALQRRRGEAMTTNLTDEDLIDRIMSPYRITEPDGIVRYAADVTELIRRYREATSKPPGDDYRAGWDDARYHCTCSCIPSASFLLGVDRGDPAKGQR